MPRPGYDDPGCWRVRQIRRRVTACRRWILRAGCGSSGSSNTRRHSARTRSTHGWVLPSLTAEDLKDLGVNLVGHRRRLLDAIAALGTEVPASPESPLPNPPPRAGEGRVGAEAERRQLTVMF